MATIRCESRGKDPGQPEYRRLLRPDCGFHCRLDRRCSAVPRRSRIRQL